VKIYAGARISGKDSDTILFSLDFIPSQLQILYILFPDEIMRKESSSLLFKRMNISIWFDFQSVTWKETIFITLSFPYFDF
jgi:hypothetical protein